MIQAKQSREFLSRRRTTFGVDGRAGSPSLKLGVPMANRILRSAVYCCLVAVSLPPLAGVLVWRSCFLSERISLAVSRPVRRSARLPDDSIERPRRRAGRSRAMAWDRGLEMAKHKEFTVATDVQVYFCDPQSP
jgi:hypothetical protein